MMIGDDCFVYVNESCCAGRAGNGADYDNDLCQCLSCYTGKRESSVGGWWYGSGAVC